MQRLKHIKKELFDGLLACGIEATECRVEVDHIIEHATGWTLTEQALRAEEDVSQAAKAIIESILAQRRQRVPLQYLLGYTYFMGYKFATARGVFIPRADTETLVEVCLPFLRSLTKPHVAEIGVGSGAVAISILKLVPGALVTGVDISRQAVELTQANALDHDVLDRLAVLEGPWQKVLPCQLDAIVSNPPYIPCGLRDMLAPEIRDYEPDEALYGPDEDALGFYRHLATAGPAHLKPGGLVAVEVGDTQAEAVKAIFAAGRLQDIEQHSDLHGLPRVITAFKRQS